MEVPDIEVYAVSLPIPAERIELPGAETSGFWLPVSEGPRELNEEMASELVVDPTPITSSYCPGLTPDEQDGP